MNSIAIPEELYQEAVEIAKAQHVTVDQVFASVFAEHMTARERLQQRAPRSNREKFLAVLDKVPDQDPD